MRAVNLRARNTCGLKDDPEWFRLKGMIQKLALSNSKAEFASGARAIVQAYSHNPRLAAYLQKRNGFFDAESWRSMWYRSAYGVLDQAWCPRTNNPIESLNSRIKSDFCSGRILPFNDMLQAMLGPHMKKCSTETTHASKQKNQNYLQVHALWANAMALRSVLKITVVSPNKHFVDMGLTPVNGDLCVVTPTEEDLPMQWAVDPGSFDSAVRVPDEVVTELQRKFPLVYLPNELQDIDAHPRSGGPICSCAEFTRLNHCYHICFAYIELRGMRPPNPSHACTGANTFQNGRTNLDEGEGSGAGTSHGPSTAPGHDDSPSSTQHQSTAPATADRVGGPAAKYGLARPRKCKPALTRMTPIN